MYNIRKATTLDLEWLIDRAPKFFSFLNTKYSLYNETRILETFLLLLNDGIVLLVEKDNKVVGALGASVLGHYFNPEVLTAFELFWWVDEDARNGRAAIMLFNSYLEEAKSLGCKMVTISKLGNSNLKDSFLKKKGFSFTETSYTKEF